MFKLPIAVAIGLTAAISSSAHADNLIVQSPFPGVLTYPGVVPGFSAYDTPSFGRLVAMCAQMGFDCSVPEIGRPNPYDLSEAAQADAEKRLALLMEEWENEAEEIDDYVRVLPAPHPVPGNLPHPFGIFGFNAPHLSPYPNIDLYQFGHRFPAVPRIETPYGVTPPRGFFPHGPVFPWPTL